MITGIEPFNVLPSSIVANDSFYSDSNLWKDPVINGTTFTRSAGWMVAEHSIGSGTGISYLQADQRFGAQMSFEVIMSIYAFDPASNNQISGIRLWVDDDNWFVLGAEINAGNQSAAMLRYKVAGAESVVHFPVNGADTTRSNLDAYRRHFRIDVLNDHLVIYVNSIKRFDLKANAVPMLNYYFELIAGTTDDTKAFQAHFRDVVYRNHITTPEVYPAKIGGSVTLSNTTPSELIFADEISGNLYELVLRADLDEAYVQQAWMLDSPATYDDITSECNDLTTGMAVLLPAVPAANDAVILGASEKFDHVDVYMDGGVSNLDNKFNVLYWNGATWAVLAVTDGTNGGVAGRTFYENGRISFAPPGNWTAISVNGVSCYYISIHVVTAGSSVPVATHIQLGLVSHSGFDHAAAFLSTLEVKMFKGFTGIGYTRSYMDAMSYRQCVGERNVEINGWRCDGNAKITFQLSETPTKPVVIPYYVFTRRL